MADVLDITDLKSSYKKTMKKDELQSFAEAQTKKLIEMKRKIDELELKKKELEHMLDGFVSKGGGLLSISPEESICLQQIRILELKSGQRELNAEEARKFDLFVKNLRLIREENTENIKVESIDLKEEDLVALARESTSTE